MLSLLVLLLTIGHIGAQFLEVNTTYLHSAIAKGAVCLDGSAPAYLLDRGTDSGINSWLVQIEGGGWCSTISECMIKAASKYGSSNKMSNIGYFKGILSNKPNENPDFYNWNRVKVRYCDGSSLTGDVENPVANLHFRGARIFSAIMEDLLDKGMRTAENAILSGTSAGGLATVLNCDKFKSFLPVDAKVKCICDAGFFVNIKTILGEPYIQESFHRVVALHESAKNLPPSCTSTYSEPSLCFFPQYVAQYVKTPLLFVNSAYDPWQVSNSLVPVDADPNNDWIFCKRDINKCSPSQIRILEEFRSIFLRALENVISPCPISYFITSCYSHDCVEIQRCWLYPYSPALVNKKIAEAVGRWFFKENNFRHISCPYPCGKLCQF